MWYAKRRAMRNARSVAAWAVTNSGSSRTPACTAGRRSPADRDHPLHVCLTSAEAVSPSAAWQDHASTCLYHCQDRKGTWRGSRAGLPAAWYMTHSAQASRLAAFLHAHTPLKCASTDSTSRSVREREPPTYGTSSQHFCRRALQALLCISARVAGRVELGEAAGRSKLSRQLALLKPDSPAALALVTLALEVGDVCKGAWRANFLVIH